MKKKEIIIIFILIVILGVSGLVILPVNAGVSYTVYATREGLVGKTTANGHLIQSNDHFVGLPSRTVLSRNGGNGFQVRLTYKGKSVVAPVWDTGPWNTRDDYWNLPEEREMWQDLPQGTPEAQAAYLNDYNGGFDETNLLITSAGSDILKTNDRVRPTIDGLKVRTTPGGSESGSVSTSDIGTVISGPETGIVSGITYSWWKIQWDSGSSGWSAQKRSPSNPAGIDLADGTFSDLGMTNNDWVTVEFLWAGGKVIVYGPAYFTVEDPEGLIGSKFTNQIPGTEYSEYESNGVLKAGIKFKGLKTGDYLITMTPRPGADPNADFTLFAESLYDPPGSDYIQILTLASGKVKDIPSSPYRIQVKNTGEIIPLGWDGGGSVPEFPTVTVPIAILGGVMVAVVVMKKKMT